MNESDASASCLACYLWLPPLSFLSRCFVQRRRIHNGPLTIETFFIHEHRTSMISFASAKYQLLIPASTILLNDHAVNIILRPCIPQEIS